MKQVRKRILELVKFSKSWLKNFIIKNKSYRILLNSEVTQYSLDQEAKNSQAVRRKIASADHHNNFLT